MNIIAKTLIIMAGIAATISACASGARRTEATAAADGAIAPTPSEFAQVLDKDPNAYILDVRTPEEYAAGHIADAHNLNWLDTAAFKQGAAALPKDRTIYTYCRSGVRSAQAAAYLNSQGYKAVSLGGLMTAK